MGISTVRDEKSAKIGSVPYACTVRAKFMSSSIPLQKSNLYLISVQ